MDWIETQSPVGIVVVLLDRIPSIALPSAFLFAFNEWWHLKKSFYMVYLQLVGTSFSRGGSARFGGGQCS